MFGIKKGKVIYERGGKDMSPCRNGGGRERKEKTVKSYEGLEQVIAGLQGLGEVMTAGTVQASRE